MSDLLIRGGRIIDPASDRDQVADVRITGGRVTEIGALTPRAEERQLPASGLIVAPGFVDICVHLREPGFENIETIRSGARAALAGGFTAIAAMADTVPPIDNEASAAYVRLRGERAGAARVYPVGALTRGREGNDLSEMGGMVRAGAVAFSDEESAVMRSDIFVKALRYAGMLRKPVLSRCEDSWLRGHGVATHGLTADLLGLPSVAPGTEEVMLERNLQIAGMVGTPVHLLHLSSRESIQRVARAKRDGLEATCSVTPAHLLLTEECLTDYDPAFKFQPPLRSERDRAALVSALADGTIDAVSSAHTPRGAYEKNVEFVFAAAGCSALETTFSLLHSELVAGGGLAPARLIELLSTTPARILGVAGGRLAVGDPGDVTCFDPDAVATVDPRRFHSHCQVTPFAGREVRGRVVHVAVGGRVLFADRELCDDGTST